jgi:hypothetical protein
MNCDQVFDILTRGPFPTGTSCDMPVEMHLSECPECHRLAEALRPAVELFQEAVDPEESRDLPGYWCAVATERQSPALYVREVASPAPLAEGGAAGHDHWTSHSGWRMAAMLTLGVTLGALFSSGALERIDWPPQGVKAAMVAPTDENPLPRITKSERMELAVLPAACYHYLPETVPRYTMRDDQLLRGASLGHLSCCSGCHNSASDSVPSAATERVAQSCHMCHAGKSSPKLGS